MCDGCKNDKACKYKEGYIELTKAIKNVCIDVNFEIVIRCKRKST